MNPRFRLIKWLSLIFLPILLGLGLMVSAVAGIALADGDDEGTSIQDIEPETDEASDLGEDDLDSALSIPYARIISDDVEVYAHPRQARLGRPPLRVLQPGFVFVSLEHSEPITYENQVWYQINPGEYVRAEHLALIAPSGFEGITISTPPRYPFGWIIRETPILSSPNISPTAHPKYLSRYERVVIYETDYSGGGWGWRRIGPEAWVNLYDIGMVTPLSRPTEIPPHQKWVAIDLFEQTLAAYDEHDRMIYATLISSGRLTPGWETPEGIFRIQSKVKRAKMSGGGRMDYYFLEDVTQSMYFTQSYALHAAYWHDDFGRYKSHGCINMSPRDAHWMFDWSTPAVSAYGNETEASDEDPGTWLWVHGGTTFLRQ